MKRLQALLLALALAMFVSTSAYAAKSYAKLGAHNITSQGCLSCHAPHNGSLANSGTQGTGRILLWDRAFSTQTFGTYSSNTMGNPTAEIGGTPAPNDTKNYSLLCMSCHDGVTSIAVIPSGSSKAVGEPGATKSYGLENDHPVNMAHDPLSDAGLASVGAVTSAGLKLYGLTNTVQCASCHDVHDNTISKFLRVSNGSSALCTTCHI